MLELEKGLIQNNLDDVLELATQQKTSFSEKYEEVNYLMLLPFGARYLCCLVRLVLFVSILTY